MSRRLTGRSKEGKSFPRVSGDEPKITKLNAEIAAFSPRERG